MSSVEVPAIPTTYTTERVPAAPIRPRVFHIVSPLTGSKATIITTDTTSSPNHAPVFIQAAQRINRQPNYLNSSNTVSRKRIYPFNQEAETNAYLSTLAARRHRERLSKGLRHFSKKVCNKVQAKSVTSYNEVATELVGEHTMEEKRNLQLPENDLAYEQKNIRRRVYDAINVLLAMNIIAKDKKDIRWVGFPVNALFECELIDKKIAAMKETIREKVRLVEEALLKQIALRNLIHRNEQYHEILRLNNLSTLPFLALASSNGVAVESTMSSDGRDTILTFDRPVRIVSETESLHRLGLSKELRGGAMCQQDIDRARALLPETFGDFAAEMAISGSLKTLFETKTTFNIKNGTSTKAAAAAPVIFVPPSFFKVDDDPPQVEEDDDEEVFDDDDDVLSLSSDDDDDTTQISSPNC